MNKPEEYISSGFFNFTIQDKTGQTLKSIFILSKLK